MRATGKSRPAHQAIQIARHPHPWPKLLELAGLARGGLYVGAWPDDGAFAEGAPLVFAQPRRCLLVCAPSQAGKTTALAIPQLLAAPGPAVSTSTKLDVFHATALVRSILGQIWVYDVAGTEDLPPGATRLRWSPVVGATTWEGALGTTRVMTKIANPSAGLQQSTFWTERSSTLLAVLLHRAALEDAPMAAVMDYAQAKDAAEVGQALENAGASVRAVGAAHDMVHIAPNEASGTWNTALVTLGAYQSQYALDACDPPNFDPETFLDSLGTVYVTAGTDDQELYAPLIVGLVESIRKAAYRKARHGALRVIQKSLVGTSLTCVCAGQGTVSDLDSGVLNNPPWIRRCISSWTKPPTSPRCPGWSRWPPKVRAGASTPPPISSRCARPRPAGATSPQTS